MRLLSVALTVFAVAFGAPPGSRLAAQGRPLSFMDVQELRRAGSWAPSPDGAWMLYTVTTPDWEAAASQTDIYLVSLAGGVASGRRLTFTDDKDETDPAWARDGSFFVFSSNREAGGDDDGDGSDDQLYMMRHDGGEARRITDAADGVSGFAFGPGGRWLVYRSGEGSREQLYRLAAGEPAPGEAVQITAGEAGIGEWDFTPDGSRIYFTRPDSFDEDEMERRERGFTADVRNAVTPLSSLWSVEVATGEERRETDDPSYSVDGFTMSDDGRWIGFTGGSPERYERNITASGLYADLYLKEVATGGIERLTDNREVNESGLSFSPDGRWIAFSAPDEMERYSMTENRVYIRNVADRGGAFRKLGAGFDQSSSVGFWSDDSETIYFNAGVTVTTQLHALDVETGAVRQLTSERAALSVSRDEDTDTILIGYSDPGTPPTVFTVAGVDDVADRSAWTQLVDVNPQIRGIALGEEVEITWRSSDGKTVGGVLVYPVGYEEGRRYPLIVAIHGGPASADLLRFNGGYNAQVYAGAGYAVLKPNYRGSRNYGNAHRTDIVGDYFTLGYEDIMTGVDHLIDEGIVDGGPDGCARLERGRPLVELDPDAHRPIPGDQLRRGDHELDQHVRPERRAAEPAVLRRRRLPLRRLRHVLRPVATQVHQEREDAHDDPCREGRSARAESAVDRAAHGTKGAGRADRAVRVSRRDPRDPGSPQPAGQGRERDGLDGPLCPGHRREVRVEPGAGDAGRSRDGPAVVSER